MRGRRTGDARSRGGDSEVKQSKPAMEKRRRARINASLAELRSLIPHTITNDNRKYTKLEKADILEMAVQYLRHLQELNKDKPPAAGGTSYSLGYSECTQEVNQFLSSSNPLAARIKGSLLDHLNGCAPHSTPDSPSSSPAPTETNPKTPPASQFQSSSIIARCLLSSSGLSGHLSSLTRPHRRAASPLTVVSSTSDDVTARGSGQDHDDVAGDQVDEPGHVDEDNRGCLIPEEADGVTPDVMTSNDMTSNDMMSKSMTSNGMAPGGMTSDDMTSNDMTSNSMTSKGMTSNDTSRGMTSDSMTSKGMTSDGMTSKGMTSDSMASDSMASGGMASGGMTSRSMKSNGMASHDVRCKTREEDTFTTSASFNTEVQRKDTAVGKNIADIYHDTPNVPVIHVQGQTVFNNCESNISSEHVSRSDLLGLTAGQNLDGQKTLSEINAPYSASQIYQNHNDDQKNSTIMPFPVTDIPVESKKVHDRKRGCLENLLKLEGNGNKQSDESLRFNENTMLIADSNGKKDSCNLTDKALDCESKVFSELFYKSTVRHHNVEEKGKGRFPKIYASSDTEIVAPPAGNSVSSYLVPIYVQTSFGADELQSFTRAFVMKSPAVRPPTLTINTESTPQRASVTHIATNVNADARASMLSATVDAASTSRVHPETESPENAREDVVPQSVSSHVFNKAIYLRTGASIVPETRTGASIVPETRTGASIVPETRTVRSHEMYSLSRDPSRTAVTDGRTLNSYQVSKASSSPMVPEILQNDQEMHATLAGPEISAQKRKYPFLSIVSNNRIHVTKECGEGDIVPEHDSPLNRSPKRVAKVELSQHGDEFYDNVKQPKLTSHVGDLGRARLEVYQSYLARDAIHHGHTTCRQQLAEQTAIFSGLKKDSSFDGGLLCDEHLSDLGTSNEHLSDFSTPNEHLSDFSTSNEHLSDFSTSNEHLCRDKMVGPLERTLCCAGTDCSKQIHGMRYKEETGLCRRETGGLPKVSHSACRDERSKAGQYVDVNTTPSLRCHDHRQPGSSHANDWVLIHEEASRNPCLAKPPQALGTLSATDGTSSYNVISLKRQNSSEPLNLSKNDKNSLHVRTYTCGSLENERDRGSFPLLICHCNGCHGNEQTPIKPTADLRDIGSTNCGVHLKGLATTSRNRSHRSPEVVPSQSRVARPVYELCAVPTDQNFSGNVRSDMPVNLSVTSPPKRPLDEDEMRAGEVGRNTNSHHFNVRRHPTRSRYFWASVPADATSPELVTTGEKGTRAVRSASWSSLSGASLSTSAQGFQGQSEELDDDVWRPW